MASKVLYGLVFLSICLLLFIHHAVDGEALPVEKFLRTSQNGRKNGQHGAATEVIIPDAVSGYKFNYAVYKTTKPFYYGFQAAISVYALSQIKAHQTSGAEIWVIRGKNGPADQISTVQAGWHVRPSLYNDTRTHFFTHWTKDNHKSTGCYNLLCPGFVLEPGTTARPGDALEQLSVINGAQYEIRIAIMADFETGDWVLKLDNGVKNITIGRWPRSLFPDHTVYADEIQWGGITISPSSEPIPPMGSGRFGSEGGTNASYFQNVQFYTIEGSSKITFGDAEHVVTAICYDVQTVAAPESNIITMIYYGGPGGC